MIFRFLNFIAITCFVELLILYIFVVKNFLWKFIPVKLYDFENLKNNGFFWEFENISPFRTEGRFSVPDWTETETQKDRTETKTQKTGPRPELKKTGPRPKLKRLDRDRNSKDWTETETVLDVLHIYILVYPTSTWFFLWNIEFINFLITVF